MLAVAAHVAQVVADEVEPLPPQHLLGAVVLERRPLELEEQQGRADRRLLLLNLLQQRAVGRVGGVGGEAQRGVVAGAADELLDRPELLHGVPQPGGIERVEPARVALGERAGALQRLGQSALHALLALAFDERLEVPRRGCELWVGRLGGGCGGHGRSLAV